MGFRAAASKNGVSFVQGEIKALEIDGGTVRHAVLADGRTAGETFANVRLEVSRIWPTETPAALMS